MVKRKKKEKLPLLNDYIFKRTFIKDTDNTILKDFLEGILEERITNVEIKNNEIPKDMLDEKLSILDIRAEINSSKIVDIELQVGNEYNVRNRSPLYMCKNISTQLKTGDPYVKIKPSISIWILNFNYYKRNSYHNIAKMRFEENKEKTYIEMGYEKEEEIATEDLEMHFIELPKFIKKNPGVEEKIEQWLWLISGKEDKIKMAEEKNEQIKRARTLLDQISDDPVEQEMYENRIMSEYRYNSGIEGAREYGLKKGLEEGIKKGIKEGEKNKAIEIAKELFKQGIDLDTIISATKLSKEELEEQIAKI